MCVYIFTSFFLTLNFIFNFNCTIISIIIISISYFRSVYL